MGKSPARKENDMPEDAGGLTRVLRRLSGPAVGDPAASYLAYRRLLRPWMRNRGSTQEERSLSLPGDAEVKELFGLGEWRVLWP